jgi:hypothetical protein
MRRCREWRPYLTALYDWGNRPEISDAWHETCS